MVQLVKEDLFTFPPDLGNMVTFFPFSKPAPESASPKESRQAILIGDQGHLFKKSVCPVMSDPCKKRLGMLCMHVTCFLKCLFKLFSFFF